MASRVRRRFRLTRGGNPNLVVMNYTRGDSIRECCRSLERLSFITLRFVAVPPAANTPIRSYPLPPITQPPAFVMGPRSPFKDQPYQPHSPSSANIPSPLGAGLGMGGGGGGMSQQAAMIAQQNSNMEMLERRREREREMRPPGHIPPPGPMPVSRGASTVEQYSSIVNSVNRGQKRTILEVRVFTILLEWILKSGQTKPISLPAPWPSRDIVETMS